MPPCHESWPTRRFSRHSSFETFGLELWIQYFFIVFVTFYFLSMRTIIVGRLSPFVSTPTHTPLVAFDQYNLRGRIILYICILSLAQQHFPQWRSGFAQSMLQLLVRTIPPMCTSSPLTLVYILGDAIVFLLLRRHVSPLSFRRQCSASSRLWASPLFPGSVKLYRSHRKPNVSVAFRIWQLLFPWTDLTRCFLLFASTCVEEQRLRNLRPKAPTRRRLTAFPWLRARIEYEQIGDSNIWHYEIGEWDN